MKDRAQRVLVIAARPEDEAYVFGATIATLVQRGTELIVLSCSNTTTAAIAAAATTGSTPVTVASADDVPTSDPVTGQQPIAPVSETTQRYIFQDLYNLYATPTQ